MKTKKIIGFDLETIANKALIGCLPEIKAKANLKDPEKIKADIEDKTKKQIADMGLSPLFNMICCAGWMDHTGDAGAFLLKEESPEAEKDLLLKFLEKLSGYDHFVTFNGRAFDLRCMFLHSMKYGIRPGVNIDKGRYNKGNHTDLRLVLAGEERFATGRLDSFSKVLIGESKTEGIDGAAVQDYWDMGLHDDIAAYCVQDCKMLMSLFWMASTAGLIE
jgi:predicted PolB exonuclease-like 3'-5' exonuclease